MQVLEYRFCKLWSAKTLVRFDIQVLLRRTSAIEMRASTNAGRVLAHRHAQGNSQLAIVRRVMALEWWAQMILDEECLGLAWLPRARRGRIAESVCCHAARR